MWRPSVPTYCNHMKTAITRIMLWFKVPSNLCHVKRGCACNLQHTQLFEYEGSSLFVLPQQKGVGWFQPYKYFEIFMGSGSMTK